MDITDWRLLSTAAVVILIAVGFLFLDIPELSIASGQNNTLTGDTQGASYSFFTGSDWTYYGDYYEELSLYGDRIYVENLEKSTGVEDDIARAHIGSESKVVDLEESFTVNGVELTVDQTKDTFIGYGGFSNDYSYYNALGWRADVAIPKDSIRADINDFSLEETGPGRRKVEFNISVSNNWNRLAVDNVQVEAFGKTHELPVGPYLEEGTSEYGVVGSFSEYDISEYKLEKTVNKTISVQIKNPRIPATEKSIEGAKSIENPDFDLPDLETESAWFTADIGFCGEASEYVDGECVIDEDLHLRGDTCFLPENYTIVTETFSSGSYDRGDVSPEASYFCTRHPAIVTNDGVQTDRVTSPYQSLVDGQSFSVPEGQTYTMFWVVNSNEVDVNRVCEEGTLNKTSGNCVVKPSVVHKCESGQWSPSQGSCVVSPDTKTICEEGRYNKELGVCVFTPEVEERCPVGSQLGEGGQCYSQASVEKVCPGSVEDGKISGVKCVTDAVTVARDSPLSSFRVFLFDLGNWFEENLGLVF